MKSFLYLIIGGTLFILAILISLFLPGTIWGVLGGGLILINVWNLIKLQKENGVYIEHDPDTGEVSAELRRYGRGPVWMRVIVVLTLVGIWGTGIPLWIWKLLF